MKIVQPDFWEFAEWIAQQPEGARLAQAATERLHDIAQAVQEHPTSATGLEAALEQFLEMTPVTQTTDSERYNLEAQISAQEERLNRLDQALRELAAIVGFDAWQRIGAIITGNDEEEEGSDE